MSGWATVRPGLFPGEQLPGEQLSAYQFCHGFHAHLNIGSECWDCAIVACPSTGFQQCCRYTIIIRKWLPIKGSGNLCELWIYHEGNIWSTYHAMQICKAEHLDITWYFENSPLYSAQIGDEQFAPSTCTHMYFRNSNEVTRQVHRLAPKRS